MKRFLLPLILLIFSFFCSKQGYDVVTTWMDTKKQATVVIDAGHGGSDPGKVGINHILEKDINLKIATYLKRDLEANDIRVVMTREKDESLSTSTTNNKTSDLSNRKEIIFQSEPAVAISIHQNSYPAESVSGAQVFYIQGNEKCKFLADTLQEHLRKVDPNNHRASKANNSYYLFKNNPYSTVIVECGFLSNPEEASWLNNADYQQKLAFELHLGIMEFLHASKNK